MRNVQDDDEEPASSGRVPFGGQIRQAIRENFFKEGMKPGGHQRAQSAATVLDEKAQFDSLDDLLGSDVSDSVSDSDSDSNDIDLNTGDIKLI